MSTPTITLDRQRPVQLDRLRLAKGADLAIAGRVVDELLAFARTRLAKAQGPKVVRARQAIFDKTMPAFVAALEEYFAGLLKRSGVAKAIDPEDIDWTDEKAELAAVLRAAYATLGAEAYEAIAGQLGIDLAFDLDAPATKGIRGAIAVRVTQITERTAEVIRSYIETAVERGYSVAQLAGGVDADGFLGLEAVFGDRAQTIALTETATAYNLASSAGYRESGLVEEVVIFDGVDCGWDGHDDPDLADGSIRSLDEFDETPISHPNCQRAAGPVVLE